jgi:uncharacterized protein (TIGR02246 family)
MRRKFLSLTLCSLFSCMFARSQVATEQRGPGTVEQSKKEVLKVIEDLNGAVEKNDADSLALILSDEVEYTNQMGEVLDKVEWLARIRSGKQRSLKISMKVDHVHVFGDTVVVTATSSSTVVFNGKISKRPRRSTRVFVKQDGRWKLVVQHVTMIGAANE